VNVDDCVAPWFKCVTEEIDPQSVLSQSSLSPLTHQLSLSVSP
jgi:hypothetical protein